MSRIALEDQKFETIKAHVLDPDNSALPADQKQLFDRVMQASSILDKYPRLKDAVNMLRAKYAGLSRSQAYEDIRIAKRLFPTIHSFDYHFFGIPG